MTLGDQDDEAPLSVAIGAKPSRRRGVNYPLVVLAMALIGVGGVWAYSQFGPHGAGSAATQGEPDLTAARTCMWQHDLPCAVADYSAYLAVHPKDPNAAALLAAALAADGQNKNALTYYRMARSEGVDTYDFDASYARSLDAVGDLDGAIQMNTASLAQIPKLVDVRGALAGELVRKGRKDEAAALLESFDNARRDQGKPRVFTRQIAEIGRGAAPSPVTLSPSGTDKVATLANPEGDLPGASEIPLEFSNGGLFAPVVVDNVSTVRFKVDSAASDVLIPDEVLRSLMKAEKLTDADYRGDGEAIMADGSRAPARLYLIGSMRVGGHEVRDVTAMVPKAGGSPVLGQSFLKRFKSWSIDNRRKVLVLQG